MVRPRPMTRSSGFPRQLPADTLLEVSGSELAICNFDALRLNALKVAPTPTSSAELHCMWIPCPHAIKRKHLAEVLDELAKDDQPQLWKDARHARLLQDFKQIPDAKIRFTCTAYDTASKLSLLKLNAFGSQIQIARFSKYGSRYYVDLVRLPDEVTDHMIFDWFTEHSAPPTCLLPAFVQNGLPSRERTVYFAQDQAPAVLVPSQDNPLREIAFPSSVDGMFLLRPCFANHKVARYNRVTPPSIRLRQEEEANRSAADPSSTPTLDLVPSFKDSNTPNSSRFESSLRKSIRQLTPDSTLDDATTQDNPTSSGPSITPSPFHDIAMSDKAVSYDSDDNSYDNDSSSPVCDFTTYMSEEINTPKIRPTAPIWAKASTNRKVLHGRRDSELVEAKSYNYDINTTEGSARATSIFKSNYYNPIWFENLDPATPQWQYDLEVRRSADDETCLEYTPAAASTSAYVSMITPVTIQYDVERMTRLELFQYVDSFLDNLSDRPPLDQLAVIEANPRIMLPGIASRDRLDTLAHYRIVCRLLAHARPSTTAAYTRSLEVLHATGKAKTMLKHILGHVEPISPQAKKALFVLSSWNLVLHVMAPTVYHGPLKLYVVTDAVPDFLVNLTIPLLSNTTLWLLGFSPFANDLLQYDSVPDFLKTLVQAVQALKSDDEGSLVPRLHF
ncbi:hypothetical protein Plhal304r1_c002g0005481 [Plasmopara halstedii]